jgi:hypothetical protein
MRMTRAKARARAQWTIQGDMDRFMETCMLTVGEGSGRFITRGGLCAPSFSTLVSTLSSSNLTCSTSDVHQSNVLHSDVHPSLSDARDKLRHLRSEVLTYSACSTWRSVTIQAPLAQASRPTTIPASPTSRQRCLPGHYLARLHSRLPSLPR